MSLSRSAALAQMQSLRYYAMEVLIIVGILLIFWTNEALFGQPLFKPKPPKSTEEKLTDALKDYLESLSSKNKDG
jgi:hypothetical protein